MLFRSSAFSVTEWRSSQRRADSRHHDIEETKDIQHQCLLGVQHRQHTRAPKPWERIHVDHASVEGQNVLHGQQFQTSGWV